MKPLITAVGLLVILAGSAAAQSEIGLYITETPAGTNLDTSMTVGTPGLYTIYAVCLDPVNEHTDEPIVTLGGFEFSYTTLPGLTIHSESPHAVDLDHDPGRFKVVGNIPVTDGFATLSTITLVAFGEVNPGGLFVAPHATAPTIPGHMVIVDAADASASRAYPSSGRYGFPVMQVNGPVPTEATSWSEVKTLYR